MADPWPKPRRRWGPALLALALLALVLASTALVRATGARDDARAAGQAAQEVEPVSDPITSYAGAAPADAGQGAPDGP
jgi:hypothetical protein